VSENERSGVVDPEVELLRAIEQRRSQSENFTWAVPLVVLTGEAFLLTIGLGRDTSPTARLVIGVAGSAAILACWHFLLKQVYYFDLFEAVIERQRMELGYRSVSLDALRALDFPDKTLYQQRRWVDRPWRQRLVVRRKTVNVWSLTLAIFLSINVGLAVYAIVQYFADPGWF
jgi:hypothetical protein